MTERKTVGITEAARILGIHPNTLRKWADDNVVPHIKTPHGYRRFSVVELERFWEGMERGPASAEAEGDSLGKLAA